MVTQKNCKKTQDTPCLEYIIPTESKRNQELLFNYNFHLDDFHTLNILTQNCYIILSTLTTVNILLTLTTVNILPIMLRKHLCWIHKAPGTQKADFHNPSVRFRQLCTAVNPTQVDISFKTLAMRTLHQNSLQLYLDSVRHPESTTQVLLGVSCAQGYPEATKTFPHTPDCQVLKQPIPINSSAKQLFPITNRARQLAHTQ